MSKPAYLPNFKRIDSSGTGHPAGNGLNQSSKEQGHTCISIIAVSLFTLKEERAWQLLIPLFRMPRDNLLALQIDVYSLGIMLYKLANGEAPCESNDEEVLRDFLTSSDDIQYPKEMSQQLRHFLQVDSFKDFLNCLNPISLLVRSSYYVGLPNPFEF